MKQRIVLIFASLLISISMFSQNTRNTYESDWKQADEFEKKSLPKSAIDVVTNILKKATADKNTPQIVKSYGYLQNLNYKIDTNHDYDFLSEVEKLATNTSISQDKALLHSILAEMYMTTYKRNEWNINQRTNLADDVPEDIKEWSTNIFEKKIIEHLEASIKDKDKLTEGQTNAYTDIIELGVDSRVYQPTLYDFVMNRAIATAKSLREMGHEEFDPAATGATVIDLLKPAKEYVALKINPTKKYSILKYYQDYLANLQQRGLTSATVLVEIDKFQYVSNLSYSLTNKDKLNALYTLERAYAVDETTVEIIDLISVQLQQDNRYMSYRNYPIADDGNEGEKDIHQQIYNWLKKGIEKYPTYKRINILENRLTNLELPTLKIQGKNLYYPNDEIEVDVIHQNTQLVNKKKTLQLYKEKNGVETLIKEYTLDYNSKTTYDQDTAKLVIGKLPLGKYFLKSNFKRFQYDLEKLDFSVSELMTYFRPSAEDECEFFAVGRTNGKPIKGATIKVYEALHDGYYSKEKTTPKLLSTLTTNDLGFATYKDQRKNKKDRYKYRLTYTVEVGDDYGLPNLQFDTEQHNSYEYKPSIEELNKHTISSFSDRSIYRPGQTVYYKSIVIDRNSKVVANKKMEVKLYNPNGEVIGTKNLVTNEFGSIAGEFILPQGGLLGHYRIEMDNDNSTHLRVEEYKRPTFEVKFDKIDKTFSLGEKITVKGNVKTYSGISLQDAAVSYNISRRPFSFWRYGSGASQFQDGTVKTKDDGTFEIEFTPETGDGPSFFGRKIYTFEVVANVTDLNGETQSNIFTISVGEVSMVLNVGISTKIEKSENLGFSISAKNLNDVSIETSGTYTIFTLNKNDSIETKLIEGAFKTGVQEELASRIKSLPSGKLRIEVAAKDDNGKEVKSHADFVIFSYNDKKPPYETNVWLVSKEAKFIGTQPAEIIYGTSNADAYILYQVYNNKTIFERKFVRLNNENKTFKIPYQAAYGNEVYVSFTSVHDGDNIYTNTESFIDGKVMTNTVLLSKYEETVNTSLRIKLDVFRDKLRPGQDETWTLSIRNHQDKVVSAEVLASMYDVSLDQIASANFWRFGKPYIYKEYLRQHMFRSINISNGIYPVNLEYSVPHKSVSNFKFDDFIYSLQPGYLAYRASNPVMRKSVVGSLAERATDNEAQISIADNIATDNEAGIDITELNEQKVIIEESAPAPAAGGKEDNAKPEPQIRKNFNETAFFFPQLRTNENGETLITFTVPESNTTWKFRALAHDKESNIGSVEKMVVTRKELMVTPNMPRFLRHGDKTSISTKVSNLSENAISGDVRIEFFNPVDDKLVKLTTKDEKQTFNLAKDASSSATWTFDVPSNIDMLGVRIIAESESFSDGEQHALAVLPNRMLVTETMPVDVLEVGEQSYTLEKLANNKSSSLDNYKLTFEFASNPAWYAVQALPTLSNPVSENAVDWIASYYVNSLGASLMKQYPKVANVINAWKKQGGNKETLVSKLSKNEELKTILLEETPWVLDAKSETEQMERLSLLFDLNNTKQLTSTAIQKLKELQVSEGAWTWYKGMYPSRSITQYMLYSFAKLQTVGMIEYPEEVKVMQMDALKYIDHQIVKDFIDLKKHNQGWKSIQYISTSQLEYLYIRAMYRDIPITQEAREAERFYTDVVSRNWTTIGLYEKSLLAVLTKELGEKDLANSIVKSIKEHSVDKKELGMYWPNNGNRVFLSMAAVSTHTFMMEALQQNGATTEEMDRMKRWLVKQKQTQVWESTHATIDAIAALLSQGSDWLSNDSAPTIKVGKQEVKPEGTELGTGYFKTSWSKSEINKDMAKVTINSTDSKPASGSLYWQYYEDLDKITKQDGALNVNKELYKEVVDKSGKSLVKITEANPLNVGDRVIVRLVVRSDRDIEFVQIKDMRASCFEPINTRSGILWQNGAPYYEATKDASTNFFFDVLPKGTYVFEYPVYVSRTGEYSNGITSIQCAYAPEFTSQTAGIRVVVK